MAAKGSSEATFRLNIDGNAADASKGIASSARLAAESITKFESEIKALSGDLRRLKGNSDEVTATKAALKKRIDEAKTSVSALTTEIVKQGSSYTAASAAAKKYGDSTKRLPNLRSALGGVGAKAGAALEPTMKKLGALLAPITTRFAKLGGSIKQALAPVGAFSKAAKEDASSVLPSLSSILGVVAEGAVVAAAAFVAVGAAITGATVALALFSLKSADAAAKMDRQRQALWGNKDDAKALGEQIGLLAGKVPQGVAELQGLAVELSKTRLSGKAVVDTMNAVAQASGAVDDSAGAKIKELLTRNQQSGRFWLGQFELQGTGINFDDVAKEYSAGTKKTIAQAKKDLMTGGVSIEDAASTIAKVTAKKFGNLNVQNAFSLENAPKKLKEQLSILSSGVDLGPISKALQDAFGQLSPNAPLGAAVKQFMTDFGGGLVDIAARAIPLVVEGFKWLVVGALRVQEAYYNVKADIHDALKADDWIGVGKAIVNGLVQGIVMASASVPAAVVALGKTIKSAFTDEMKIHSPSRVFEGYGRNTVEGYAQGVDRASGRAADAVVDMVPGASGGSSAAAGGSSAAANDITVNVYFQGGSGGGSGAGPSPQMLSGLTQAIRDALSAKGLVAA